MLTPHRKPWYVILVRFVYFALIIIFFPLLLLWFMCRQVYMICAYGLSAQWPGEDEKGNPL